MWDAYFCMGAYKHEVVVIIKMVPLSDSSTREVGVFSSVMICPPHRQLEQLVSVFIC